MNFFYSFLFGIMFVIFSNETCIVTNPKQIVTKNDIYYTVDLIFVDSISKNHKITNSDFQRIYLNKNIKYNYNHHWGQICFIFSILFLINTKDTTKTHYFGL